MGCARLFEIFFRMKFGFVPFPMVVKNFAKRSFFSHSSRSALTNVLPVGCETKKLFFLINLFYQSFGPLVDWIFDQTIKNPSQKAYRYQVSQSNYKISRFILKIRTMDETKKFE